MGLFGGGSKQSAAGSNASGGSQSGIGDFAPTNRIYMNGSPLIDFTNPLEVAAFGGLCLLGWYSWRKFK